MAVNWNVNRLREDQTPQVLRLCGPIQITLEDGTDIRVHLDADQPGVFLVSWVGTDPGG